ncbi:hypothetical protein ACHHYP_20020 [Achlya hypogyna]|uniref:Uncharacterized protein n=1 Tax=Achlya hypogyna TaxID=1202772 RepID=A0A1V9ZAK3_ACHHY|nr:hypothetical protein ACHHYP_20020 [Achlya hypogyna]
MDLGKMSLRCAVRHVVHVLVGVLWLYAVMEQLDTLFNLGLKQALRDQTSAVIDDAWRAYQVHLAKDTYQASKFLLADESIVDHCISLRRFDAANVELCTISI